MNIVFTTYYSDAIVKKDANLNDVITSIYGVLTGVDSDSGNKASVGDDFYLDPPDPAQFIPFESVTKDVVDSWVTTTDKYKKMLDLITRDLSGRSAVEVKPLPWATPTAPPPANPVPDAVSPLQIRLALNMSGLRDSVDAYVATLNQTAKDAWEYATVIERSNSILVNGAKALGKTDKDLDDLFILAATLSP